MANDYFSESFRPTSFRLNTFPKSSTTRASTIVVDPPFQRVLWYCSQQGLKEGLKLLWPCGVGWNLELDALDLDFGQVSEVKVASSRLIYICPMLRPS